MVSVIQSVFLHVRWLDASE